MGANDLVLCLELILELSCSIIGSVWSVKGETGLEWRWVMEKGKAMLE